MTSFTLAVDRAFKAQSGEKKTDFIDIVAWRTTAEVVADNVYFGDLKKDVPELGASAPEFYDGHSELAEVGREDGELPF